MRRTPAHGGAGRYAAKQDSVALRPERRGQSHASDSPVPGEGEVGCLFDEIDNLVEPTERPAMEGALSPNGPARRRSALERIERLL
jgi:hypothetical protein